MTHKFWDDTEMVHERGPIAVHLRVPTAHFRDGGLLEPGNIDVSSRPIVRNPDGSVSTIRSIGVNVNGKEVLIPTVVNGKVVSNKEAIDHYIMTGEHLGIFATPQDSTAFAQKLHEQEEQRTMKKARGGATYSPEEQRLLMRYASR